MSQSHSDESCGHISATSSDLSIDWTLNSAWTINSAANSSVPDEISIEIYEEAEPNPEPQMATEPEPLPEDEPEPEAEPGPEQQQQQQQQQEPGEFKEGLGSTIINGKRRSQRLRLFEVTGSFTTEKGLRRSARLQQRHF